LPSSWSVLADAGYIAGLLTFIAFFMKDSVRLRQVALVSNVFYALWAADIHLIPTLILHLALFPVNLVRLIQLIRERHAIESAISTHEVSAEWLTSFMERRRLAAGTVLFLRGDPADAIYFLAEGRLRIDELGIDLDPGVLIGEIGLFSPDGKRTQTIRAIAPSSVYALRRHEALGLYRRDPAFGIYLTRLITQRLVEDVAFARQANAAPSPPAAPTDGEAAAEVAEAMELKRGAAEDGSPEAAPA
jgi:CRP-like cAMP-binding protein